MKSRRVWIIGVACIWLGLAGMAMADNWAVIVGIDKYEKIRPNLSFCVSDAKYFQEALLQYCGFQPDHIKTLFDEQATKANIRDAVTQWLAGKVKPGDKAVFYFSGHGVQVMDVNQDEEDGYDEALVAHDSWLIDTKFIIDEELSRWMDRVPTTNKIVVLDCCHSGTGIRALDPDVQVRQYYPEKPIQVTQSRAAEPVGPQFQKTSLLSACDADQVALESKRLGHGVFTYYLRQSLSGKADLDNDGRVSVREVAAYATQKIKADGWEQDPQLEGEYAEQYFAGEEEVTQPYGVITAIEGGDTYTLTLGEDQEAPPGSLCSVFDAGVARPEGIGKGLIEIIEVGPAGAKARPFQVQGDIQVGDRVLVYRRKLTFEQLRVRAEPVEGEAPETRRREAHQLILAKLRQFPDLEVVTEREAWADRVLKVSLEPSNGTPDTYHITAYLLDPRRQTEGKQYTLLFTWDKLTQAVATIFAPANLGGDLEGADALKRLSKLTNPEGAPVHIQLELNRGANGIYAIGDELSLTATVDRDCWLTILDIGSSGNIVVLFPNKGQPDNHIRAGEPIRVPPEGWRLRVGGPPGSEVIKAIATLDPLDVEGLNVQNLRRRFKVLDGSNSGDLSRALTSKDLFLEPEEEVRWAEASVHFRIAPDELYQQQRAVLELQLLE